MEGDGDERRRYPRVKAPIYFRAARFRSAREPVVDIGVGGFRVFSDDPLKIGDRVDITLFLPAGETVECTVRVVWQTALPEGSAAKFDLGFQILDARGNGLEMLSQILDQFAT